MKIVVGNDGKNLDLNNVDDQWSDCEDCEVVVRIDGQNCGIVVHVGNKNVSARRGATECPKSRQGQPKMLEMAGEKDPEVKIAFPDTKKSDAECYIARGDGTKLDLETSNGTLLV